MNISPLYIMLFIGGGLFGWLIDTSYRSFKAHRYAPGTLLPFFAVIYGFAAVIQYVFFKVSVFSFWADVFLGTIICSGLELTGGVLSLTVLRYRLWDYRRNRFNFYGLIDLKHTFYWLTLTVLYRLFYIAL